ncbi:MAG: hypothetical protein ACLQK4_08725 [Acidimicrobiales bacterium]
MGRSLTVHMDDATVHKAKVLAAGRATSISRLVATEIERLVDGDHVYQRAQQTALTQLTRGFHLGGGLPPDRESLHERLPAPSTTPTFSSTRVTPTLARRTAREVIGVCRPWPVHRPDVDGVTAASGLEERHQLSFWDALVLVSAQRSGARTLLSEDLQPGRHVGELVIVNTFVLQAER